MHEFFKGWRRKVGCVALALALVVMAGWIRSRFIFDNIVVVTDDQTFVTYLSCIHGVGWYTSHYRKLKLPATMHSLRYSTAEQPSNSEMVDGEGKDLSQNLFVIYVDDTDSDPQCQTIIVRYFVIAIPLTLLAAYLILWKPRKSPRSHPQS